MKQNRTTGQPEQRCSGYFFPHYMLATRRNHDRATAFGVTGAPCSQAAARSEQSPEGSSFRPRSRCEVLIGSLNVGTMEGKALEVVEMMQRRRLEVLCVQETKWKGDRARQMAGGYKMMHAGGDGRSNGVGGIVSEEISRKVVRVERWNRKAIAVLMIVQKQLMCVISVYGPQTGRTEAEKQDFRDEVEKMMGLVEVGTMLCVVGDFNAHVGLVETGDEESIGRYGWGTRNREGQDLAEMVMRNGMVVAGSFFKKRDSHKVTYSVETTKQNWPC